MNALLNYHKKVITQDDLAFIIKAIDGYLGEGRSDTSRRHCEAWNLRQTNNHLKDGVCRTPLLQPERRQPTPPRIIERMRSGKEQLISLETLVDFAPIELRQARQPQKKKLFDYLIRQYTYPGELTKA